MKREAKKINIKEKAKKVEMKTEDKESVEREVIANPKRVLDAEAICILMKNPEEIDRVRSCVKPEHFSGPHLRWLYETILKVYDDIGVIPDRLMVQAELSKNRGLDEEERSRWSKLFDTLFSKTLPNAERGAYAVNELMRYGRWREVTARVEQGIDHLEQDRIEEAIKAFQSTVDIETPTKKKNDELESDDWFDNIDKSIDLDLKEAKDPSCTTGITWFSPTLSSCAGKLYPGEIAIVAAYTNNGKGVTLVNEGAHLYLRGYKVLHLSLEDPKRMVQRRYNSRILQINYFDQIDGQLSLSALKTIHEGKDILDVKGFKGNLRIRKLNQQGSTPLTIETELRQAQREGFETTVLIVDFADKLQPILVKGNPWLDQGRVFEELEALADRWEIPIITACQVKPEAARRKAYSDDIAGSSIKVQTASLVFTMNRLDLRSSDALLIVAKGRNRGSGFEIPLDYHPPTITYTEKAGGSDE